MRHLDDDSLQNKEHTTAIAHRPPRQVIREMPGFQQPPDSVESLKAPVIHFSEAERTALFKK